MGLKSVFLTALALGMAIPAQAQQAAVFQPSGSWTADYGDDYCRLIRTFSDGKNELSLALERTQPGQFTRLIFVGSGLKPYRNADEFGYHFGPAGSTGKTLFARSKAADGNDYFITNPVALAPLAPPTAGAPPAPPPYDRAQEKAAADGITALTLSEGLSSPVRFETGSLGPVIGAMQACTDDLLKVWNLNVDQHKAMSAAAMPIPGKEPALPMGTIPFNQFGKFIGGANEVRLAVAADGKVTSCVTRSPSLAGQLNKRVCDLIVEKATFSPAKDAEGQPMASFWMGSPLAFGPPPPGR